MLVGIGAGIGLVVVVVGGSDDPSTSSGDMTTLVDRPELSFALKKIARESRHAREQAPSNGSLLCTTIKGHV